MDKKNKSSTTTIKQTFSYGKSKTVTVEVIKKKDNLKKFNKTTNNEFKKEVGKVSTKPRKKLTIGRNFYNSFKKSNQLSSKKKEISLDELNQTTKKVIKEVKIPEIISVQELSNRMAEKSTNVIKALMKMGVMLTINQNVDADTAEIIAAEFGHKIKRIDDSDSQINIKKEEDKEENLKARSPVVTIMGHVDHGKTTLLDVLRSTNIVSKEHGGITQHIGAYRIKTKSNKFITFFDTPGHEAFSSMRARGAKVTDIVILVVAADDGVKEQTVEAINHAKAAKVPIIVCINKIDSNNADPQKIKNQLMEHEILSEDMGGENLFVEISAKEKKNLDKLEEIILLQSEILDLKANPNRKANGTIVESKIEQGKGSTATVLIQGGTLRVGDVFVAGPAYGKVRAMSDDKGLKIVEAGPSIPVEIIGLTGIPFAGDEFIVINNEIKAKEIADFRLRSVKMKQTKPLTKESLEKILDEKSNKNIKELSLILKSDVQGSLEAIINGVEKFKNDEIKLKIIHKGIGAINESDVSLATATENTLLVGFNVKPNKLATNLAKRDKVNIQFFTVIYELLDYVKDSMSGLLVPDKKEILNGKAKIKEIFKVSKIGKIAGCEVIEGKIEKNSNIRLLRDDQIIYEGKLNSLKRFKEETAEVKEGNDCGIVLDNFQDIKPNDILEAYIIEEQKRSL